MIRWRIACAAAIAPDHALARNNLAFAKAKLAR